MSERGCRVVSVHGCHALSGVSTWIARVLEHEATKHDWRAIVVGRPEELSSMRAFPGEGSGRVQRLAWSGDPHNVARRIETLDAALTNANADVVIPNYVPEAFAASLLGRPLGRRTLGICHSRDAWYLELFENAGLVIDGAWSVSNECADLIACTLPTNLPTLCAPYGTHLPAHVPELPMLQAPGEPIRLLYLGRIESMQKRVGRLVDLVRSLDTRRVNFEFTIVGDGPEFAQLDKMIGTHERVHLRGAVSPSETPRLVERSDCLVLVSAYEGNPLAAIEALALGRPLLLTDGCGGACDAVRSHGCGVIVEQSNIHDMSAFCAQLANEPSRLEQLSLAARSCADSRFSFDAHIEQLELLLDEMRVKPQRVRTTEWEALLACASLGAQRGYDDLALDVRARWRNRLDPSGMLNLNLDVRRVPRMGARLLREAIDELIDEGFNRIGIFPAGRHSRRIGDVVKGNSNIICFIDDDPSSSTLFEKPVLTPSDALDMTIDSIVVSSDQYEHALEERARSWAGDRPVRTLYVPVRISAPRASRVSV